MTVSGTCERYSILKNSGVFERVNVVSIGCARRRGIDRHLQSVIHARTGADTAPHPRISSSLSLSPSLFLSLSLSLSLSLPPSLVLTFHRSPCLGCSLVSRLLFRSRSVFTPPFFCRLALAKEKIRLYIVYIWRRFIHTSVMCRVWARRRRNHAAL